MNQEIGETAGAVWNYLRTHPSASVPEIKMGLKRKEFSIWMAIGWLAREDKLAFEEVGDVRRVSLRTAA